MKNEHREKIDILLIEDNPADVKLLKILLSDTGKLNFRYSLKEANSLNEGIKLINKQPFDIILLDLSLPDSTGFDTVSEIYNNIKEIPIVVLTGLNDIKIGRRSVKLGAQDYLIKGKVDANRLIQSIYHAIDRHKMKKTIEDLAKDLKQKEERLRKIINSNADAIIITNNEGNVEFINPAAEELFHCRADKMIGKPFGYEINNDGLNEICIENSEKKYAEIKSVNIEWNGENAQLLTLRDITKNKKYEELLKKSEKKYRKLFENSPYPIIILNSEGKIIDCNSNLLEVIDINKNEILNKSFEDTIFKPIKNLKIFSRNLNELKNDDLPESYELKLNVGTDNSIWLDLKFSLLKLDEEPLIHILIRDITEIKQSRKEMRKLEKTLHEMNMLIEHAPMAIFLIYRNGKILRTNKAAIDLFNYSEGSLLNQNIIDLYHHQDKKKVKKHYKKDVFNLKKENKIEAKIILKNGAIRDVEITSNTLKIANNLIIQSFISDITNRKENEKNRELLLDRLIRSLEFKSKFLATMSHDLRTPLNAIIGFSSLLLDQSYGKLNNNQEDYLDDIYSAAKQLNDLINAMLDISKIEIGGFNLNKKRFDLYNLIKQMKSLFKPLYKKKDLFLHINGIDETNYILADPVRFKQILYNLIDNAIKFTDDGGITFRVLEYDEHWEFQVEDTGIGIEEEDYEVVFREFGRIENDIKKDVSGSGIGLSLTKRLVELHGGEIWFESQRGEGTTFFFTIPKSNDQKADGSGKNGKISTKN